SAFGRVAGYSGRCVPLCVLSNLFRRSYYYGDRLLRILEPTGDPVAKEHDMTAVDDDNSKAQQAERLVVVTSVGRRCSWIASTAEGCGLRSTGTYREQKQ